MKKIISILTILILVFSITGCSLDVITNDSVTSFENIIDKAGKNVFDKALKDNWTLKSEDNEAYFNISKNFEKTDMDISIMLPIKPFTDAGLEKDKLPEDMVFGDFLIIGINLENSNNTENSSLLAAYENFVDSKKDALMYHVDMGHFGVDLKRGAFEFAKDASSNELDLVFIVDPVIIEKAGANLEEIAGFKYAKVKVMDNKGVKKEVYKLIKAYNFK